jgi:hypothetical protein
MLRTSPTSPHFLQAWVTLFLSSYVLLSSSQLNPTLWRVPQSQLNHRNNTLGLAQLREPRRLWIRKRRLWIKVSLAVAAAP